jgi:hypothetical protein
MPRAIVGLSRRRFQSSSPNTFSILGKHFIRGGVAPRIKLRCKHHYWTDVVVENATDTEIRLHATPGPKTLFLEAAEKAGKRGTFDETDDLNITLTWNEGTPTEEEEHVVYDETEFTP